MRACLLLLTSCISFQPTNGTCRSSGDCGAGKFCANSLCLAPQCKSNTDCGTGLCDANFQCTSRGSGASTFGIVDIQGSGSIDTVGKARVIDHLHVSGPGLDGLATVALGVDDTFDEAAFTVTSDGVDVTLTPRVAGALLGAGRVDFTLRAVHDNSGSIIKTIALLAGETGPPGERGATGPPGADGTLLAGQPRQCAGSGLELAPPNNDLECGASNVGLAVRDNDFSQLITPAAFAASAGPSGIALRATAQAGGTSLRVMGHADFSAGQVKLNIYQRVLVCAGATSDPRCDCQNAASGNKQCLTATLGCDSTSDVLLAGHCNAGNAFAEANMFAECPTFEAPTTTTSNCISNGGVAHGIRCRVDNTQLGAAVSFGLLATVACVRAQ